MTAVITEAWRTLHPRADDEHGALAPLLVGLTVVTGVVDAVSYLSLGHVFVANMTGNVVFLAFALSGATAFSVVASLVALAAFSVGALAGGRLTVHLGAHRGRLLLVAVAAEAAFVAVAVGVALGTSGSAPRDLFITLLGVPLGIQNACVRRLAVPDLTTTVLTLTLTGVSADSRLAGGAGGHSGRRLVSALAMFGGACVGATLVLTVSRAAALGTALALLAAVAAGAAGCARSPRFAGS